MPKLASLVIIMTAILAGSALAWDDAELWPARDSGIGSYSNVNTGSGWQKICCDYPYYHPRPRSRAYRRPK